MKKVFISLALIIGCLTSRSQGIVLQYIGNEGIPLDSVVITNLDKSCDTTLYGIEVYLYLQAISIGINETPEINTNSEFLIHDLLGKQLDNIQLGSINILTFPNGKSVKIFGQINQNTDYGKLKSSSGVLYTWVWDYGDMLKMDGFATGYFTETLYDSPIENTIYIFDFEPSITGVVRGNIYYENTLIPIPNVNVSVAGNWSNTDSTGYFEVVSPIGNHALYATKEGYDDYGTTVSITTSDTVVLDIEMTSNVYTYLVYGTISIVNQSSGIIPVWISNPDSSICLQTYTNNDGYYEMYNVPFGIRNVHIESLMGTFDTTLFINNNVEISHEFIPDVICEDSIITYEGQEYHIVQIGNQCWIKENLNVGIMIEHPNNQSDNDTIEKYCFNNDLTECETYGGLYQWNEMMKYVIDTLNEGICPSGWRIPTDFDYIILEGYADSLYDASDPEWYDIGNRGYDVAKKLKATESWIQDGNGIDLFGFSALAGGALYNGQFQDQEAYFDTWTSLSVGNPPFQAVERVFNYQSDLSYRSPIDMNYGVTVRCVKN